MLAAVAPAALLAENSQSAASAYGAPAQPASGGGSGEQAGAFPVAGGDPAPAPAAPMFMAAAATPQAADTVAPVITGLTPPDGTVTGPTVFISASYSDPEPSSGINTATAMIHIDDRHQYGCTITGSGISLLKTGLSEGPHKIEAFICDKNYNCAVSAWHITVDATGPVISGSQPTGTINSKDTVISSFFSDEDGAGVDPDSAEVLVDGENITAGCQVTAGGIACPATGLGNGEHHVRVSVSDLVGNRSSGSWSFSVNTAAIGVTGQYPVPGSWTRNSMPAVGAIFQQAGTGIIDVSSITLLIDGVDVSTTAERHAGGVRYTPSPQELAEGWHAVSLTVGDDEGYVGQSEWSFAIDTIAPVIRNVAPTGLTTSLPSVSASYSDDGSGMDLASIDLIIDGLNVTGSATVTADSITYVPHESFASGPHNAQLSVRDLAGNLQVSAWSFSVPAQGPVFQPPLRQTNPGPSVTAVTEYWLSYINLPFSSGGSWVLSGFHTFPATYFLPWYGADPAAGVDGQEIVITNRGAGEASVYVLVSGENVWEEKLAEGGTSVCRLPGISGGPVKIISPTGNQLEVVSRTAARGGVSESPAVAQEDLEPVLLMPWFESLPASTGRSTLIVANAGSEEALVELYVGDPALAESLRGSLTIGPEAAVETELPGVRSGPVRIESTNGQPLTAVYRETAPDSYYEALATGFSRLNDSYRLEPGSGEPARGRKLVLGNGNDVDKRAFVSIGGEPLDDPENPGEEFIVVPRHGVRILEIPGDFSRPVLIKCEDCKLGEGLSPGFRR